MDPTRRRHRAQSIQQLADVLARATDDELARADFAQLVRVQQDLNDLVAGLAS